MLPSLRSEFNHRTHIMEGENQLPQVTLCYTHLHVCAHMLMHAHTHSHTKQNVKRKRTCSVMRRWGKKAWGPVLPEHSPYLALGCTSTNPSSPRDYMVTCASYEIKSISQLYKKKAETWKNQYTPTQTHLHTPTDTLTHMV